MESNEEKIVGGEEKLSPVSLTESSRALRWLDNFWYHHKWGVIVTLFFAVILIVGIVQICDRESYDMQVSVAVPYTMKAQEKEDFVDLLAQFCRDYNEDGKTLVFAQTNQVYSAEEYESEKAYWEEQSEQFYIDSAYNSSQLENFEQYIMQGECTLMFLSPYVYSLKKESDHLLPLVELYGDAALPSGATEDGLGIRLAETDFYRYNPAAHALPADTIICLQRPLIDMKNWKTYDDSHAREVFRAIADYCVKE